MKKLLPLGLFIIIITSSVFSQNTYDYVFTDFETYIKGIAVQDENLATISQSSVSYFDTLGDKKWERHFTFSESNPADLQRIFFDQEQNIIIIGTSTFGCDIAGPDRGIFVTKLDTLGNILFFTKITFDDYSIDNIDIIELKNSNYLIASDSSLIWVNSIGDSLKAKQIGYTRIKKIQLLNDSTLFLMTGKELVLLDLEGNTRLQIDSIFNSIGSVIMNNSLYVLNANNLEFYTNQLSNKALITLPNSIEPLGITQDNQTIIIWGKEITSQRFQIFQYKNSDWEMLYTSPKSIYEITDVKVVNSHYYLAGRDTWGGENAWNTLPFVKSTSNLADTISNHDLFFLAARTTLIEYDTVFGGGGTVTYHFEFDIQNNGTDTINSFMISTGVFFSAFCTNFRFQINSENITLPSGEKITIKSTQRLPYIIARLNGNPTSYCFFLAAPNHSFENNQSNNKSCSTTSVKEIKLPENSVTIFPNPAFDQVQIQTENELQIKSLHLFNIASQLQNIKSDVNFNQATLHRSSLSPGLYWLKIQTEKGFVMKKVIFQ